MGILPRRYGFSFPSLPVTERRSIPTRYRGRLFRSKLECDWARAFDALGVVWEYEKEGAYWGDVFYLPDFWLPRSRQFVEVKAIFEPDDCRRIQALLSHVTPRAFTSDEQPDIPLVAYVPGGNFYGWMRSGNREESFAQFLMQRAVPVLLFQCDRCEGWWFAMPDLGWGCRCCRVSDGARHLRDRIDSPLPGFPHVRARVAF